MDYCVFNVWHLYAAKKKKKKKVVLDRLENCDDLCHDLLSPAGVNYIIVANYGNNL